MIDYLIDHAIQNVWCNPDQDNQLIISPARITPFGGVINKYKYQWDYIPLPDKTNRYHIYQIGQIHPLLINLFELPEEWVKFSDASNLKNIVVDLYVSSGVQLPRVETYYMLTENKNVIIAVKQNALLKYNFNTDAIYLRVYDNAYYATTASQPLVDVVYVNGKTVKNTNDILALQTEFIAKQSLVGLVYCFVNGYRKETLSLITVQIGDIVEFVYDSSIKNIVDFPLSGLPTFDSILDLKGKYLLHNSGNTTIIDYQDDIDLFLINIVTGVGVYVHKNMADTIRMLTHKDYSLVVPYISSYLPHFSINNQPVDLSQLVIRQHVRKSGYIRSLVLEKNRINELYKLPDTYIQQALLGVNSTVPVWRADNLEASKYPYLMTSLFENINRQNVVDAYGYSAIAKLVADTPKQVTVNGSVRSVAVGYLLASGCTAFEYDADGLLINWYIHTSGTTYVCVNNTCVYVELIAGEATDTIDEVYGQTITTLDANQSYRFYSCPIISSIPNSIWVDKTNSSDYSLINNELTWTNNNQFTLVRSDKKFLCYSFSMEPEEGVFEFSIKYMQNRTGIYQSLLMQIPMGELDVFLNGKSLVEGIDYYFDNPKIVIVNKTYLKTAINALQDITIRFSGFCTSALEPYKKVDYGFVQRDNVSDNHNYDIHDGKVQRIVVGGSLKLNTDISYLENNINGSVFTNNNGKPYSIRDIVVPMKAIAGVDTYSLKTLSDNVDTTISNYLTIKLNQITPPALNLVPARHKLYSPFLARVLNELIDSNINLSLIQNTYDDITVRSICNPYEELLRYDPIHPDRKHNSDFVVVYIHSYPSVINLDLVRYRFITRVTQLYGQGIVDITNSLALI